MLCDAPAVYEREPDIIGFISKMVKGGGFVISVK